MKKRIYSVLSIILTLTMLTACGKSADTKATTSTDTATTGTEAAEVVQLDVFSASTASTTAAGVYDNTWWGKILQEQAGVSLNILPTGDQAQEKLQALMASGELPDIIIFSSTKDVQSAIRGNMLLNLDDYLDKLPNVEKNASIALQYSRDNNSNDTGKAYAVTNAIGPADIGTEPSWGPYLRWDLYQQIGAPEINTWDDYLSVLQKMQALQPENADGKKTYGITLWKDWDNYSMFLAQELGPTIGIDCGDQLGQLPYLQVDFNTGETMSTLDENSQYIQALRFYYEANQLGLVDPDSLTQTYDTAKSKITEGRVFFSWWSWLNDAYNTIDNTNAEAATGFAAVLPTNTKTLIPGENNIGKSSLFAISSTTKNVDACLAYIDFMYSTDGLQQLFNGPEGVTWETDSEGVTKVTEEGWKYINDPALELPDGGTLGSGLMIGSYGLSTAFINPTTSQTLNYKLWPSTLEYNLASQTNLQKDWSSVTGYNSTMEYLKANDMTLEIPIAQALIPAMTDDISSLASKIGEIVKENSWKMIFAKDDAEFESYYNDMKTKAEGLGLETVYSWSLESWNTAKTEGDKYK
ncbi:MAG: extracellular solute-binding protein [Mobilitalea sp.]